MSKKQIYISVEDFHKEIMPDIEDVFESKLKEYRDEVVGFKVEVLGEIEKLRDEVTVAVHQYERTNKRVDKIAKHLDLAV